MNKRQWIGLLMIYVGYLSLGATVFYYIESPVELDQRREKFSNYGDLIELMNNQCYGNHNLLFEKLSVYFEQEIKANMSVVEVAPPIWDYYNSFFFVVTVVSTIGYGNLHPTTDPGRALMIIYAIIGIPLNGILLTSLAQFFGAVFLRAHKNYKNHGRFEGKVNLVINILTYLIPGMIFFIFLPAGIFTYFEGWDYIMSVYYAFVTLTTIGFGDLVAGQRQDIIHSDSAVVAYKVMLIFWIIFGLGYLIMLLGFVAQAMNSRKIVEMEQKLMSTLTHSRLWHGFSKDIGYLRRLLNEVYLDKLKPVFREDVPEPPHTFPRSKSLPQLFITPLDESSRLRRRKRAMSEHVPNMVRMLSESDLQRIDKNATFAACAAVPSTAELMRKVIDAYGARQWPSTEDDEDDDDDGGLKGIDGFSDEDVLASEKGYDQQTTVSAKSRHPSSLFFMPSYEDTVSRQPHRGRAMSECPPPELKNVTPCTNPSGPVDWTWSGPAANKLHDIIKQRNKQKLMLGISKERKASLTQSVLAGAKRLNPLRLRRRYYTESEDVTKSSSDIKNSKQNLSVPNIVTKRRSLQENRLSEESPADYHYMTHTAAIGTRNAEDDLLRLYSRGGRLFDGENSTNLLEETSLGDFLRALTNIHSRVGERIVTAEFPQQQQPPRPKRKLGTASLTPPRIRSLLDLFEPPMPPTSPKVPKKRKPSKMVNAFKNDVKKDTSMPPSSGSEITDKQPGDDSHIKRLGRFLLRSYSIVSKDVDESGISKPPSRRKRFSLWPSETEEPREIPPFQLQVDSPTGGSMQSLDVIIPIEEDCLTRPSAAHRPSIPTLTGILTNPNPSGSADIPKTPVAKRKTSFIS